MKVTNVRNREEDFYTPLYGWHIKKTHKHDFLKFPISKRYNSNVMQLEQNSQLDYIYTHK